MWKDDAIDLHINAIARLLADNTTGEFRAIVFVGQCVEGMESVTASVRMPDGSVAYHQDFFDFAPDLKRELRSFHSAFEARGEDWKAIRLEVKPEGRFDLQFEYNDPDRWDE